MSGPVTPSEGEAWECHDSPKKTHVERLSPRRAVVGGFDVARVLPQRARRMIGPWCFVDVMGPGVATDSVGLNVGPHPHIGLQTVTWLIDGALLHRDSLGTEQPIQPGQLNLMTAGHGVSHSEETMNFYHGPIFGVQMWLAQPEHTRHTAPAFEHHASLPRITIGTADITVFVGEFHNVASPARTETQHVGVEIILAPGSTILPLNNTYEYGLLVLNDAVRVDDTEIGHGELAYLGTQRDEVTLTSNTTVRMLLLGGERFSEDVLMWWNYVARSRDEISLAHYEWSTKNPRFGTVATDLPRVDTRKPPWDAHL